MGDQRKQADTGSASETTPLLNSGRTSPDGQPKSPSQDGGTSEQTLTETNAQDSEEKPFDAWQILFLCYASLVEPIGFFSIFPFINEMIFRTGEVPESDVGFWSGLIESLFSVVQMLLMIFYGRMSDRLGRKPVLVFSQLGVSLAVAGFGFSRTIWQMILLRCVAGLFAGSVVTIRVMISENCDKAGQARAFSWFMFTRNIGILIGPMIGGGLARPADEFPGAFGHIQFFHDYPFALPGFVTGAFSLTATAVSLFLIKETLKRDSSDTGGTAEPPMTTWEVLKAPGVPIVLVIFGQVALHGLVLTAMGPLCFFTSVGRGGFSFSERSIAISLAICGLSQSLFMLVAFPPLHRRYGTGTILRTCAIIWPWIFLSFPIFNQFLRHHWDTAFWISAPIVWTLGCGVSMAFTCTQLCINDISPSQQVLGTTNALALTVNSGVRAVAPVIFTSIYAIGVRKQWLDGGFGWVVLFAFAGLLPVVLRWLPEAVEGKPKKQTSS